MSDVVSIAQAAPTARSKARQRKFIIHRRDDDKKKALRPAMLLGGVYPAGRNRLRPLPPIVPQLDGPGALPIHTRDRQERRRSDGDGGDGGGDAENECHGAPPRRSSVAQTPTSGSKRGYGFFWPKLDPRPDSVEKGPSIPNTTAQMSPRVSSTIS